MSARKRAARATVVRITNPGHMRQAIVTRYAGPTDVTGSRVIVRSQAGRMIIPWDHALGAPENHAAAAREYAHKRGWFGEWTGGGMPDGSAYCFTLATEET